MAQQTTRKAGIGGLLPRALVLGLALGLMLFPITGLRSSLVLDAGTAVHASSRTGLELGVADAGTTEIVACPDDMIAYWHLDEPNGVNGYEDSYGDHDGVCGRSCPTGNQPGQVGRSQKFSATGTREINVPASADFDWGPTDSWTIEVWAKRPIGDIGDNEPIIGRDYSPSNADARHWWLGLLGRGTHAGKVVFYAIDNDKSATGSLMGDDVLLDNTWHHLVVVRDGAAAKVSLYVDRMLQDEDVPAFTSGFVSPKELNIGWINFGQSPLHYGGFIDEVAVYGRALTGDEIEGHYYAGWAGRGYCSNPALAVNKLANPGVIYADDTVQYTYLVSNPGDVGLEGLSVVDDKCAGMSLPTGDNGNGVLDPGGEVWTYTCSMALSQDTTNTVTASGTYTYPLNATLTATDTATVNVVAPTVVLAKVPDNDAVYASDTVTYTYTATNTSNDTLTNVTVVDDKCLPVVQQTGDSMLSGGEVQTYSCSTTLTEDTTNEATLSGRDELGRTWTFTGTATVDVIAPDVEVVKTADPQVIYAGDTVNYSYQVTNDGDDVLSNVNLTDNKCAPVTPVGSNDGNLRPGETLDYACSTTLVGDTTNTGIFTGQDVLGKTWTFSDTAFVRVLGPQIAVAKRASQTVIYPGDTVRYDYDVTNPGNDPLSNIQVTDDKCSPLNFVGVDSNGNGKLDPGETWGYWCQSGPLTEDTTNTATATGRDSRGNTITSPPARVTVDVIKPGIGLNKTAVRTKIDPGDTAVYRYEVTNTGDDPLSNVTVTDDKCAPVTYASGDTNLNSKLDVGETWVYGCSTVLHKNTTNTATATGEDSAGGTVSASDTATVNVEAFVYLPFIRRP